MVNKTETDPSKVPLIYADGVLNLYNNASIVKFYLARADPAAGAGTISDKTTVVAQIAMPLPAFIETYAFFHSGVQDLVKNGFITQEAIDEAVKIQGDAE